MKKFFSLFLSILKMVCPRCRKGRLFRFRSVFHPSKILRMNNHCDVCGLKYMIEPSFYFGSMYITYIISVTVALTVFFCGSNFFRWGIETNLFLVFAVLFITTPFQVRLSRSIWIHIFVRHQKPQK